MHYCFWFFLLRHFSRLTLYWKLSKTTQQLTNSSNTIVNHHMLDIKRHANIFCSGRAVAATELALCWSQIWEFSTLIYVSHLFHLVSEYMGQLQILPVVQFYSANIFRVVIPYIMTLNWLSSPGTTGTSRVVMTCQCLSRGFPLRAKHILVLCINLQYVSVKNTALSVLLVFFD